MERRFSGVNGKKNSAFFNEGGNPSPSVLEEESNLLFSPVSSESADSGEPAAAGDFQSIPSSDARQDAPSDFSAGRRQGSESPRSASEAVAPPSEKIPQPQGDQTLIERLRHELTLRRQEDSVFPSTRRPRLEKKAARAAPQTVSVHPQAAKTVPASTKRAASSRISPPSERTSSSLRATPRRTFLERLYSAPLLGYPAELLAHLFRLPVLVREINIRQTKKDTVVQARLDGMGSRLAALREGASLCRREMEEALSADMSRKVDAERFESFTLNLEAELSRKASAESLEELGASWEAALSELKEELGEKAGNAGLRALEDELRTKADAESAAEIEGKVERILERLGAFDGNAALERLESLEERLVRKAELDEVEKLLSEKLDANVLKTWEKGLESVSAELREALSKKADAENVEAISTSMLSKADAEALESLSVAKADAEDLRSLGDRFASLGAQTAALADSLESLRASKADSEAVRSLGERFGGMTAQLGALEGESVLKRLSSAESAIELKADLEIVKSLLSLKMDVEVLKSLGESLKDASGRTLAALEKKADLLSVESLGSSLEQKADAESVRSLNGGLSAVYERLGGYASKEDLSKVEELEQRLSRKADADALEKRLSALDAKADLKTVEEWLSQKADAEALTSLSKEVEHRLAEKADAAAVDEALAKKAGNDALEVVQKAVENELNGLHARIEERSEQASEEERRLIRFREEVKALIASSLERGARGQIEEAFRATFPYVQKMKDRFPASRGIEAYMRKKTQSSGVRRPEETQSRKRVKR